MYVSSTEIEIAFDDLTEEAQREFLEAVGLSCPEDGNYDVQPIAVIPIPEDFDVNGEDEDENI